MSVVYLMYFRSRKTRKKHNSKTLKFKREKQKKKITLKGNPQTK